MNEIPPNIELEKNPERRALEELNDLGLRMEDMIGKKTLDIGAGDAAIGQAAHRRGIDVVSLDTKPPVSQDIPYVIASAEKLPFEDESFDYVISHAGPLVIAPSREIMIKVLQEARRVLKEGGQLRFGPGNLNANIFTSEELFTPKEEEQFTTEQRIERIGQKALEFLHSIDDSITQEDIPNPTWEIPVSRFYRLEKITEKNAAQP